MNSRERFLAACRCEPVDRPPVWMMRQAGRYLPEYREIRSRHGFLEMCKTPEIAAEITLQPIHRLGMDAAILFSDILVIPEAMGIDVEYAPGGPRLSPRVSDNESIGRLRSPDPARDLAFTANALKTIRSQLGDQTALIGFAGAPFTLATYMVEGGGSRDLLRTKRLQYDHPDLFSELLSRLASAVAEYLLLQIRSGVDAVQLFDTWAGSLSPADYAQYALPFTKTVIDALRPEEVPVILYINGISGVLDLAVTSGADVVGIDWRMDLDRAYAVTGPGIALQGNLDPVKLYASRQFIEEEVRRIHQTLGGKTGHIFNLGHGILPTTPVEGAAAFIETVQHLSY